MKVFVGSEALASGRVTRYELRADHRRVLPDVYLPKRLPLTLDDRIAAAWLWSGRRGVVSGLAASALHGSRWVGENVPIELNLAHNKSPRGVLTRRDTLLENEIVQLQGMAVTSVPRTAFDLARRDVFRPAAARRDPLGSAAARRDLLGPAVARLDALARSTHFEPGEVLAISDSHPRIRGRKRVSDVLELVDEGAQSPKETWLRLLLIEAGFPRPQTQIPVLAADGYPRYFLDMGWQEFMVTAEYDGEQHRTDPAQYRGDVTRSEYIAGRGWRRIAVLAGDRGPDVIRRVEQAGVPRAGRRTS